MATSVTRRDFARLFGFGGAAALLERSAWTRQAPAGGLAPGGPSAGDPFWKSVRDQFVVPPDLAVMNAANLCPASRPALEALARNAAIASGHKARSMPTPSRHAVSGGWARNAAPFICGDRVWP